MQLCIKGVQFETQVIRSPKVVAKKRRFFFLRTPASLVAREIRIKRHQFRNVFKTCHFDCKPPQRQGPCTRRNWDVSLLQLTISWKSTSSNLRHYANEEARFWGRTITRRITWSGSGWSGKLCNRAANALIGKHWWGKNGHINIDVEIGKRIVKWLNW